MKLLNCTHAHNHLRRIGFGGWRCGGLPNMSACRWRVGTSSESLAAADTLPNTNTQTIDAYTEKVQSMKRANLLRRINFINRLMANSRR